jgi:hypothetical protein
MVDTSHINDWPDILFGPHCQVSLLTFMMTKKVLLTALFLFAASNLLLHFRIHNFMAADPLAPDIMRFDRTRFLAFIFPLVDVFVVTLLFTSGKTAVYGYLLNGLIVIYGTVFMSHYSIAELTSKSAPIEAWFLKSTLPDIGIAWGDFLAGKALYDIYLREHTENQTAQERRNDR